jgi:hypothetical protein
VQATRERSTINYKGARMNFYRDQRVGSLTIDETLIERLFNAFQGMHNQVVAAIPAGQPNEWFFTVIIRFDGKGFRLLHLAEVLEYFKSAKTVERVVFTVENGPSMRSNRMFGSHAELRLDAGNPDNCVAQVMADTKASMDLAFNAIEEALVTAKNAHWFMRSSPVRIFVQLLGIVLGFAVSLWGASKLGSKLNVDGAFLFAFLFVFIVFSNLWGYFHTWMLGVIDRVFPNVYFKRGNAQRWSWLWQNVLATALFAIFLVIASRLVSYILSALEPFWIK